MKQLKDHEVNNLFKKYMEIKDRKLKKLFERYEEALDIYDRGVLPGAPWVEGLTNLGNYEKSRKALIKYLSEVCDGRNKRS